MVVVGAGPTGLMLATDTPGIDLVHITVRIGETEHQLTARYLVACDGAHSDGAHSTVRRLLGMPFPGDPGTRTSTLVDIRLAAASATVPTRVEQFASMVGHGGGYWTMLNPLEGWRYRLVFGRLEPGSDPPRDSPVTPEEVDIALHAVHGPDTRLGELLGGSRFSDATRQLEHYRAGRVLFAGDAAHIHLPLGGQGLNLGIRTRSTSAGSLRPQCRAGDRTGCWTATTTSATRSPRGCYGTPARRGCSPGGNPTPTSRRCARSSPTSSGFRTPTTFAGSHRPDHYPARP